jgi:hypothetical protein
MNLPELPDNLKQEIILIANKLEPNQIIEGLEDLITREKYLLMNDNLNPDNKEIIMHELAVLIAALSGYIHAVTNII